MAMEKAGSLFKLYADKLLGFAGAVMNYQGYERHYLSWSVYFLAQSN